MSDSETAERETTPVDYMELSAVLQDVGDEVDRAFKLHSGLNSLHEGWAVIYEELKELEAEVFKRRSQRDLRKLREEAIQTAAMSIRLIIDVIDPLMGEQIAEEFLSPRGVGEHGLVFREIDDGEPKEAG